MDALEKIRKIRKSYKTQKNNKRFIVTVSFGTSAICLAAKNVYESFIEQIKEKNIADIQIIKSGDSGLSSLEPIIKIAEKGKQTVMYYEMTSERVGKVIDEHMVKGKIVTRF